MIKRKKQIKIKYYKTHYTTQLRSSCLVTNWTQLRQVLLRGGERKQNFIGEFTVSMSSTSRMQCIKAVRISTKVFTQASFSSRTSTPFEFCTFCRSVIMDCKAAFTSCTTPSSALWRRLERAETQNLMLIQKPC